MNSPAQATLAGLRQNAAPPVVAQALSLREINALPQPKQFPAMLESFKNHIRLALPQHLTADRMARLAMTCFNTNRQLHDCDPQSVFASVILASQLGLELGVDGQAYLVPYRKKGKLYAQMITGWKGHLALIHNAGKAHISTGVVFKGDKFDYMLGSDPFVRHQPTGESDETAENVTHAYAVGHIKGQDEPVIEVWPVKKIRRHLAKYNKVGDSHYALSGDAGFIGYARKVPLLQVAKYLPRSVQQQLAAATERGADFDLKAVLEGDFTHVDTTGTSDTEGEFGNVDTNTGEVLTDRAEPNATAPEPSGPSSSGAAEPSPAQAVEEEPAAGRGGVQSEPTVAEPEPEPARAGKPRARPRINVE